jgi:hypothetical protein
MSKMRLILSPLHPRCLQMKITKGLTWPFLLFTFAAL